MDMTTLVLVLSFFVLSCFYLLKQNSSRHKKFPPGPYPLPIIGNLHQLGKLPHQTFAQFAKTYGPVISLRFGTMYTVVVTSPEMIKEILQKHDMEFSSRVISVAVEAHGHNKLSVGFSPVGKQWKILRKISKEHMFSAHRLDASQGLRKEKFRELADYVDKCCTVGRVINVCETMITTSFNLMSNTLFSLDIADFESHTTHELKQAIDGLTDILTLPNAADFFPILRKLDPQGVKRKSEIAFGRLLCAFEVIIDERLESRAKGSPKKQDMLETLLDLGQAQGSEYNLSPKEIQHLFVDLFVGGTHPFSASAEWAMTELLINPDKMAKAQNELRTIFGTTKHEVEESDISRLPYLQAVVKETLRLHPPGPFLVPHKAIDEVEINGYTIPKDSVILINQWAVSRLSSVWSNPNSFEPERFLDNKIDYKGQDWKYVPFGAGRRICPGLPMVQRTFPLTLATMIHNFDWKLEPGMKEEDLNTHETYAWLGIHKAPLNCVPVKPDQT